MNQRRPLSHHAAIIIVNITFALLAGACERNDKSGSTRTSSANAPSPSGITTTETTKTPAITPMTTPGSRPTPVLTWKGVGLSTPESVLHDETSDTYLVSNIEGKPTDADGKGFISKLGPDGTVVTLKWIEGGKNKATLNAPKGMAIVGDKLYVADLDTVRIFDRNTGAPVSDVKIPGATFLNDVALGKDGSLLVSDTGLKAGAKGTEPSGSDAVYSINPADKRVTPIARSKDLGGPNGLATMGDKIWVVTMGSGELYSLDAKGKKSDVQKLPKGSLDGIVVLGDEVLISSWDANAVYRGKPGGELKMVIEDVKSPADMGYDKKRSRLLIPNFNDSEVRAYELK